MVFRNKGTGLLVTVVNTRMSDRRNFYRTFFEKVTVEYTSPIDNRTHRTSYYQEAFYKRFEEVVEE